MVLLEHDSGSIISSNDVVWILSGYASTGPEITPKQGSVDPPVVHVELSGINSTGMME